MRMAARYFCKCAQRETVLVAPTWGHVVMDCCQSSLRTAYGPVVLNSPFLGAENRARQRVYNQFSVMTEAVCDSGSTSRGPRFRLPVRHLRGSVRRFLEDRSITRGVFCFVLLTHTALLILPCYLFATGEHRKRTSSSVYPLIASPCRPLMFGSMKGRWDKTAHCQASDGLVTLWKGQESVAFHTKNC